MDTPQLPPEAAMQVAQTMPVAPSQGTKYPITNMDYHGKHGEILRLHIMNILMNIITLGIYSFWGKTRIRRYMTSHLSIQRDRFEYTGTGKELLLGWIKAMIIFLPLFICLYIPVINIPAIFVFLGILSVALFLALRYRLSRTKWRGIRFNLKGGVKEYFILSLKRAFINIFTLGWKIPVSDILLWSYIANNMSYGDLKFSYQGDPSRLRKIHLITLSIFLLGVVVPIIIGGIMLGKDFVERENAAQINSAEQIVPQNVQLLDPEAGEESYAAKEHPAPDDVLEDLSGVIGIAYLCVGIAFLGRFWYHAALWREKLRGLSLGELRFKTDVTGFGLLRLYLSNILLTIFTLGLAKPIAAQRTLRYMATNIRIAGDLSKLTALQAAAQVKSGMGDALAADVGFDMGL